MTIKQLQSRYKSAVEKRKRATFAETAAALDLVNACTHPPEWRAEYFKSSYFGGISAMGQICLQCGMNEQDEILPFVYLPNKYGVGNLRPRQIDVEEVWKHRTIIASHQKPVEGLLTWAEKVKKLGIKE